MPDWTKKIHTKVLSFFMTGLYVVTVIPLLILGHFNWPSADDMSLALQTHRYYVETGSLTGTFFKAFEVGFDEYMTWMGYYFSNVAFCYSPSIFGEKWHFLVGYVMVGILTLGVCYFFNALFVKGLKGDKHLANTVSMLTLIIIVQSMERGMTRVEAFYWYSGAVNYMFMFGLGLFWLGLLIRSVYDEKKSSRTGKLVWAIFWGFWLGGANYMTALELAICSFLVIVIYVMVRLKKFALEGVTNDQRSSFGLIWLPAAFNLLGFMFSVFAPGNATREAQVQGVGALKAVFMAFYYAYDMCITDFTRWEVIVAFVLLIPICYKLSKSISHRFNHPFIFALFAFGMVSSNMVPPIYALGNLEAGRLRSIIWAEYVVMIVLTIFYFTAWLRRYFTEKESMSDSFSKTSSLMIITCILFLAFGSVLCVHVDPHYYSASSAVYDIATGNAAAYLRENRERLEVLEDSSVTDPVFKPYSANPDMLVFFDITRDKEDWINKAMARYYNKNSVVLEDLP
jgi:hypothetical protein